jgi:gliding motility-associated-like protein
MLNLYKEMYPRFSYFNSVKRGLKFIIFAFIFFFAFFESKSQCPGLNLFASNTPLNCQTSTANATVTVSGGTAPYTYTWLPAGGNFSVATGLAPNSYTINVKDAMGCPGQTQLIILNSAAATIYFSTTNIQCFGQNTGQIIATVSGSPTYPITYSWTPTAPPTATITNLNAGNYTLVVTDNAGCNFTGTTSVTQPPVLAASISTKTIACNGGLSNATVTAIGGPTTSTSYTYAWAPTVSSSSVISNINAGTYSVTVKDANGCSITQTTTITEPAPITNTLNLVHATCNTFTNGQASSNLSGGTPAYSYTWLPVNAFASSVSGLGVGTYTLLVKDARQCAFTQTFTINQPAPITYTFTHKDEFCINADGSATVTTGGGTGPYTYSWSTSSAQTGSVATGLAAGTYSVFITDANNCKVTGAVTIGNTSNMSASISSMSNASCNGICNGTATGSISGGSGPYTYSWVGIPSATAATITGLCPGQYTVKITDVSGCYTQTSVTITEPPVMNYSVSGTNIVCYGQSTTLTGSVTGGTPGYVCHWQPGSLTGNSVVVTPTTTTGFSLTVTDSKGCTGPPKVYSVTVNAPISINAGANSLTVCPNVTTSVTVNAIGGNGIYTYNWMPGNITTNSISVNLASTVIYTVTISDGCGSTPATETVSINVFQIQNPSFTVSSTKGCEPFCVQFSNTSTGTTTALWNFGDFSPPVVSPVVTHCYTNPGTYSVALMITNAQGCKFTLIKPNIITVYGKPVADFVQHPDIIDLNHADAVFENASVNATSFSWSLDGMPMSSQSDFSHTFSQVGCYDVQLVASNIGSTGACRDTIIKEICVTEGFNFWMPNAFSPDLDGHNDYFYPQGTGWVDKDYKFEIYNRWGQLIFQSSDTAAQWDGRYGGMRATDEIYVWHVFVRDIYDDEHDFRGHVLIMR